MSNTGFSYEKCIQASERVRWTIDEVLGAGEFDFGKRFLPESLAQVDEIACLSPGEKLLLNQIRGLTYAHLFGFVEEFIVQKIIAVAGDYPFEKGTERRALLMFAEEEVKHQLLFERTKAALRKTLGDCGLIPGAGDVAGVVLSKSELGVLLLTDMLEWTTQHHYTDVFRTSEERESLDPTFVNIFKCHWIEESQHTKLDHLEILRVAKGVSPEAREAAIDELLEIGGAFDGLLEAQAELDVASLERLAGRELAAADREEILTKQHKAYRHTFLVSGLRHPKFNELVAELTSGGAAKLEQAATALSA